MMGIARHVALMFMFFWEMCGGAGGVNGVFSYICKGVRRWAGAAGDRIAVDTVEMSELQFFALGLFLEIFEFRGVEEV